MPVATSMTIVDAAIVTATDDRPANDATINTTTSNPAINAPASDATIDATTSNSAIDATARDTATMETATTAATKTTAATTTAAYGLRNGLSRSRRPTMRN